MKFLKTSATNNNRGITLLLVIVILSAILSIGLGIFTVVFGELRISGAASDSFVAFYSADRAIERFLYLDRVGAGLANGYTEDTTSNDNATWCYKALINKGAANCGTGANACITATGQYRCGSNPSRVVRRGFSVTY